jgi:hypothetical protein
VKTLASLREKMVMLIAFDKLTGRRHEDCTHSRKPVHPRYDQTAEHGPSQVTIDLDHLITESRHFARETLKNFSKKR